MTDVRSITSADMMRLPTRTRLNALTDAQRDLARTREWMLTNGLGGYAMGTLLGANSRRYHGLLVATTHPPVSRLVVLHSLVEQVVIGDETIDLATQSFGDTFELHPDGWRRLVGWTLEPEHNRMSWHWRIGDIDITRRITMRRRRNAITVDYTVSTTDHAVLLRVRPLVPLRDYHELSTTTQSAHLATVPDTDLMRIKSGFESVGMRAHVPQDRANHQWRVEPEWWSNFGYREDHERGQDYIENIWSPGVLAVSINADTTVDFSIDVELESPTINAPQEAPPDETPISATTPVDRLVQTADQFIALREDQGTWATTILAGFPWFADWGRDAMISLPGLLITTNRLDEARSMLELFGRHRRNGLIPNRFDDYGNAPHYNTVDASLWYVHAVYTYATARPDDDISDLLTHCADILRAYERGTNYGIRRDGDGLITAGNPTTQLTWMDAKRDGVVFTPRHGKAIEINALYYNALCVMAELTRTPVDADGYRERAGQTAIAMQMNFWWAEETCCHDVLLPDANGGWQPDNHLRPNQIFAVSLPFSPLTDAQQRGVVDAVTEHLLTPYGLRTLDPRDAMYVGRYEGDLHRRDAAYHNGTVWPWLIGPYCDAVARVEADPLRRTQRLRDALSDLLDELDSGCAHQLAEVYDGDAPHRPNGCPAQAWSVAEVLRTAVGIRD
ncbi:MAG: amylo-alpha-1,6-glucosidase [Planctomycetota bacterium]